MKQENKKYEHYYFDEFLEEQKKQGFKNLRIIKQSLHKLFIYFKTYSLASKNLNIKDYLIWVRQVKKRNGKPYAEFNMREFMRTAKRYYQFLKGKGIVISHTPEPAKSNKETTTNGKWTALIKGFEDYLMLKGKREKTIREYKINTQELFKYLEEKGLEFHQVKVTDAQEFQGRIIEKGKMKQGGYVTGTIVCYMKMAISFFDYLKYKNLIYSNPFKEIRRVKERKKLPKNVLKENEMIKLLQTFRRFDEETYLQSRVKRYRLHVLAELMYSTGMRIGEAANIQVNDIDFDTKTILLRETKEKKERIVFLNEYAKEVLQLYVKQIRPVILNVKSDKTKLFGCCGRTLKNLFNCELKKMCKKAGLIPITSKGFRHAFGYHFLRAGCDMRYIQAFLGHTQLTSTERYTKVDKEDLREVIDKYHPRQWKGRK